MGAPRFIAAGAFKSKSLAKEAPVSPDSQANALSASGKMTFFELLFQKCFVIFCIFLTAELHRLPGDVQYVKSTSSRNTKNVQTLICESGQVTH